MSWPGQSRLHRETLEVERDGKEEEQESKGVSPTTAGKVENQDTLCNEYQALPLRSMVAARSEI